MRIVMTSLAVLALAACQKPAEPANDMNMAEENVAMEENAADANMATPAAFQINDTSWEFTDEGKAQTMTVDASGNYVSWSGDKHVDHGTAVVQGDKVCFDSAMDKEGPECWTTSPVEVGQSFETTSDKGGKLTVKKVAFIEVPDAVKP
jgi:hypothetical protein